MNPTRSQNNTETWRSSVVLATVAAGWSSGLMGGEAARDKGRSRRGDCGGSDQGAAVPAEPVTLNNIGAASSTCRRERRTASPQNRIPSGFSTEHAGQRMACNTSPRFHRKTTTRPRHPRALRKAPAIGLTQDCGNGDLIMGRRGPECAQRCSARVRIDKLLCSDEHRLGAELLEGRQPRRRDRPPRSHGRRR